MMPSYWNLAFGDKLKETPHIGSHYPNLKKGSTQIFTYTQHLNSEYQQRTKEGIKLVSFSGSISWWGSETNIVDSLTKHSGLD